MIDLNRLKVVLVEQKKTGKWLAEQEQDSEPFEDKMQRLTGELATLFEQSHTLETQNKTRLESIGYKL